MIIIILAFCSWQLWWWKFNGFVFQFRVTNTYKWTVKLSIGDCCISTRHFDEVEWFRNDIHLAWWFNTTIEFIYQLWYCAWFTWPPHADKRKKFKYFQWQPQQDMLYFSDHIHCGTAVKKNDKINVSNVHFYFFLVHHYYLFLSRKIFKQKRTKAPKRPKEVNETNRGTQKNGGRSHHCTLSEP